MMDPFRTLGLRSDATEQDVKRAFRELAKKLHPDLNPNDPRAAEKFKEINEAYTEALERIRVGPDNDGQHGWDDIGGWASFTRIIRQARVNLTLEEAYFGVTKSVMLDGPNSVPVTFPPGTMPGMAVTKSIRGMELICVAHVLPHARYRPMGRLDLQATERIGFVALMTGGHVEVETLSGKARLMIPPMTRAGTVLRLAGKGYKAGVEAGDLYLTIEGQIPDSIDEAKKLLSNGEEKG